MVVDVFMIPNGQIDQLEQVAPNTTVDLIGILKEFGPENRILTKKDQREVAKRDLTLVDETGRSGRTFTTP